MANFPLNFPHKIRPPTKQKKGKFCDPILESTTEITNQTKRNQKKIGLESWNPNLGLRGRLEGRKGGIKNQVDFDVGVLGI